MDVGLIFFILLALAGGVGLWFQSVDQKEKAMQLALEEERRASRVKEKYRGTLYADDIAAGLIRQGMTHEMVIDAWGQPASVDRKVYKTKTKEILKYNPGPRRTYGNKVTLEDGVVVGWESR